MWHRSFRGAADVEEEFFEKAKQAGFRCSLLSDGELSPDRAALRRMNVAIWKLRGAC